MHTFVYHENASGDKSFTKTGDAWNIDDKNMIFAVGDSPLRCLIRDTKEYPFDDYGYEAASTFCNSFIKYTKEYLKDPTFSTSTLKEILIKCNREIYKLNKELNKKYKDLVNYDLAETVGVGALIKDNKLYYGGVEDCYVHVLRGEALKNIATWDYQIKKASKYIDKLSSENKLKDYIPNELKNKLRKENEWEPCWCNYLRNNINAKDENGELVGWGCFTGEDEISSFIQTYSVDLQKGDHILLFSDGMLPIIDNKALLNWIVNNYNNSLYFQYEMRKKISKLPDNEKTLIIFTY